MLDAGGAARPRVDLVTCIAFVRGAPGGEKARLCNRVANTNRPVVTANNRVFIVLATTSSERTVPPTSVLRLSFAGHS